MTKARHKRRKDAQHQHRRSTSDGSSPSGNSGNEHNDSDPSTSQVNKYKTTQNQVSDVSNSTERPVADSQKMLLLAGIFLTGLGLLVVVYVNMPEFTTEERAHFKLPRDIEDAKRLGRVLSRYKNQYFYTVLMGDLVVYVFLQSFAIPGSIFLTILSGFLFPFPVALSLVCMCSAVGACICYLLSYLIGRTLVIKYWPNKVTDWSCKVAKHREHLLNYIIFLRITPFLPNWFINIASPVIDVPLAPFFWGTFIGVAPPSILFVQAGRTLYSLTGTGAVFNWSSIVLLVVSAVASLAPVALSRTLRAQALKKTVFFKFFEKNRFFQKNGFFGFLLPNGFLLPKFPAASQNLEIFSFMRLSW